MKYVKILLNGLIVFTAFDIKDVHWLMSVTCMAIVNLGLELIIHAKYN